MAGIPSVDDVKKILKSILVSSPVKLQVHELNQHHKDLIGIDIPFKEYGYDSLIDFLKIFPDILRVNGNSSSATVSAFARNVTYNIKKKKRRRNRKKTSERAQNQTAWGNDRVAIGRSRGLVVTSQCIRSSQSLSSTRKTYNSSNTMRVNIGMNINFEHKKMHVDTKIACGNVAKSDNSVEEMQEKIEETVNTQKKELRYPKSIFTIEKNGDKVQIVPIKQVMKATEGVSEPGTQHETCCFSTIVEERKTRNEEFRKSKNIPSLIQKKPPLTEERASTKIGRSDVIENQNATKTAVCSSILDEPVPSTLPEVPEVFTKPKSDDLIDLNFSIPNFQHNPLGTSGNTNSLKRIPIVEVLSMVKNLQLCRSE